VVEWGASGTGSGQFESPVVLDTDADGNLYAADSGNNRLQKFAPDGGTPLGAPLWTTGIFGDGNGQFSFPIDVTIDPTGNIYVADMNNHRIQKFSSTPPMRPVAVLASTWGRLKTLYGDSSR
jgi:DNA-binding beta-propeller fold protein YncE